MLAMAQAFIGVAAVALVGIGGFKVVGAYLSGKKPMDEVWNLLFATGGLGLVLFMAMEVFQISTGGTGVIATIWTAIGTVIGFFAESIGG